MRPSLVFRCQSPSCAFHPILGVFSPLGALRILRRDLKLEIPSGSLTLGCRSCGSDTSLTLPLSETTHRYLSSSLTSLPGLPAVS